MSRPNDATQGGLSTWAIRNPIPTLVFFIVMTFVGLYAYKNLRINNFPDVDLPVVSVTFVQSGAAPAELENQVTRIVEDAVTGIGSVKHVNSIINDGVTTTVIEFQLGVNIEKATNDVRNAVAGIRSNLPSDVQDPVIQREEASGEALITYIIRADGMSPEQLSWFVDNDISKKVQAKKGVAKVTRSGGVDREIRIELDPQILASRGITAADVSRQLRNANINLPGGRLNIGSQEQSIRTLGNASSVAHLAETRILLSNGTSVRLDELGKVLDTWGEPRNLARFNGQEVVGFEVYRSIGSSEVDVAENVLAAIDEITKANPQVKIEQVTSSVDWVLEDFVASEETLAIGALLAVFVVWLFLRDLRATFVAAMAMPMSLLPTFFVLYILNDSFNIISLLALSLTIGILVDDAIVEIENIVRHMNEGRPAFKAAVEAADEIGLAVIATTATIIAVFAPVGFMPGVVGQFFKSFALAACVSVFFSLVVARTLTPLMGAYMLRSTPNKEHNDPFWMKGYLGALNGLLTGRVKFISTHFILWLLGGLAFLGLSAIGIMGVVEAKGVGFGPYISLAVFLAIGAAILWFCIHQVRTHKSEGLHVRWLVLIAGIIFFFGSNIIASKLPSEFIPAGDDGRSFMSLEMPPGTKLYETDGIIREAMAELKKYPEVKSAYANIGLRRANMIINLVPRSERKLSQQQFEAKYGDAVSHFAGARISFGQSGGGGTGITFNLVSDNPEDLARVSKQLEREMRGLSSLKNVSSSENLVRPEIIITPKPDQAAMMGVSAADISSAARVATVGDFDQILAKFNVGDRQIPIRVLMPTSSRENIDAIKDMQVPTKYGSSVPLSAVADIHFGSGPIVVNRIDRSRSVTIRGDLNNVASGIASADVRALPAYKSMPESVKELATGDAESQMEMATGFMVAIITGIMLMYVVLVLLFKSFTHPLTILSALPLSFGGAFFLLMVTGKSISMPVLIGLIMLTGIAAKNSILLVEYALVAINNGMSRYDALMDAAHKRARPIIMTTVAMGAGMLPIALGFGASVSFRSPMAMAVIGGLLTSTLLSLLFVPVFYTLIDDMAQFFGRHISKYFKAEGHDQATKEEVAGE